MFNNLSGIEKFRYWCHKVIPLVYDDSLSYYEFLCKVVTKLNEVITLSNGQNDVISEMGTEIKNWEQLSGEKYDEFVAKIESDIAQFEGTIIGLFDEGTNYEKGEYVVRENITYKATENINAGEWDASKWEQVVYAADLLARVKAFEVSVNERAKEFEQDMKLQYEDFLNNYLVALGIEQTTGDSETKVMSQKAVTDETQNICLTQIKGIEAVGNMLPNYAEKVMPKCYCHIVNGKVFLADNETYTTYKFRVTSGTYYFIQSRWVVVTDAYGNALNEVPSEDISYIDVSAYPNAVYVWYATIAPNYFSKYIPNMLQAYKNNLINEPEIFTDKNEDYIPTIDSNWYTSLQKGLVVSASMTIDNIDGFVGATIRFVQEDNTDSVIIRILKTYIEVVDYTFGNPISTVRDHGLTLANNLQIVVRYNGNSNVYLDVVSNGKKYSMDAYSIKVGRCRPVLSITGNATNIHFSAVCEDINKKIWGFGDSYFAYNNSRWVYYLLTGNYKDNMLVNAYSGENSVAAFNDLQTLIKNGTPKYIFWCLGMNDGSDIDENTPSAQWGRYIDQVIELCKGMNITPILATIPTVPTVYNEGKNKWVRESGYQYVDFAKAVGASSSGVWYDGMLSSDGVHPDTKGGLALYYQVLADFPQIMITK